MNNDRDRLLSFVTDALDNLDHYIQYPHRNAMDLLVLGQELDKLRQAIDYRLGDEFSVGLEELVRKLKNN